MITITQIHAAKKVASRMKLRIFGNNSGEDLGMA